MKILRILLLCLTLCCAGIAIAQPAATTFAVDAVEVSDQPCDTRKPAEDIARNLALHAEWKDADWQPDILTCSFSGGQPLIYVGEDVVYQMLLRAWLQHRPVSLSPDVIWLLICQQFSHCVHQHPEAYRETLVSHRDRKDLSVRTGDLFSESADWERLISDFTDGIARNTRNGIAEIIKADFSTSGTDERIASEVTLMDVAHPFFEYIAVYGICGIPSVTLTGTPGDWRKVLEKTRSLSALEQEGWMAELLPLLEEFVRAAEGTPNLRFWKDMVKKTRPRDIRHPSCGKDGKKPTRFDGWFLKFFPYCPYGRTPKKVTLLQDMLPETVVVPFNYVVEGPDGKQLQTTPLELVAGIVGVEEDAQSMRLTPKIGWLVRTVR